MQVGAEMLPAMGVRKKPSGMQVLLHETVDKFGSSNKGSAHHKKESSLSVREDGSIIESIEEILDKESVTSPTPPLRSPEQPAPAQPVGGFGAL